MSPRATAGARARPGSGRVRPTADGRARPSKNYIVTVLPVMERGPTGRVTREEQPAECLRSPAYILLTTCARCKRLALYKQAASAPLQPFQREAARSVCRASSPRTSHPAAAVRRLSGALVPRPPGPLGCVPSGSSAWRPARLMPACRNPRCGCCRIPRSTGIVDARSDPSQTRAQPDSC